MRDGQDSWMGEMNSAGPPETSSGFESARVLLSVHPQYTSCSKAPVAEGGQRRASKQATEVILCSQGCEVPAEEFLVTCCSILLASLLNV